MTILKNTIEKKFTEFIKFIKDIDGKPFTSFKKSDLIDATENYKYSVYNEAREKLRVDDWKPSDIGSGKIHLAVSSAIKTRVRHKAKMLDNNLVNWRKKDNFSKISNNKELEKNLFKFYTSKISDKQAFENFITEKLSYQFIAYLFFIKDRTKYVPILQTKFDEIFEEFGITNFKTSHNLSWQNYLTFIDLIKQIQKFLIRKDQETTLLDAHSFVWVFGNQMKNMKGIREEDDELTFPEGKELFRLHRSKERNRFLIDVAKGKYLKLDPKLRCQVCKFSFAERYGELGEGFIEAHHTLPVSELTQESKTKIEDLAFVCSNCHRMLHRKRPWKTLEDLKKLI
jgi:hypothetical protein